jgi:hypothetical protein
MTLVVSDFGKEVRMTVNPRFEQPGTFPKPGPIGRIVRLLAGIGLLYFFAQALIAYDGFVRLNVPRNPLFWIGVALCFFGLPTAINIGFGRSWGHWPQIIVLVLGLAAVIFDLIQYGSLWGPPLGLLAYVLIVYFTAHVGLSFLVQAIFATPG